MGLFSLGGGKTSTSSSSQVDNRRVLGEGASSTEMTLSGSAKVNSGILLDGNSKNDVSFFTSTNNMTTDLGAIEQASRIAQVSAQLGAGVASDALSGAFHFGSDALGLSADAIGANSRALTDSLDFGGNALDSALSFGKGALASSLSGVADANDSALSFGRGVFGSALASIADAFGAGMGSADASRDSAYRLVDNVVSNSVGLLEDQMSASRAETASLVDKALGQVQGATAMLGNAYADSQGRGALTDKMLMVAIGGAVLIAVAAVWRK